MELKYEIALYICGAVALVYIVLTFISLHRKRKYKGGSKVVVPDYLKNLPYYKFKVRSYKVMKFLLSLSIISSILLSGFLMARPYKTETTTIENYNRDIIICMDISTTVDELNEVLVDKLIDVVEDLEGQKVGIVIFNTSPVLICPLTTDYDYVIDTLETIREALEMRTDYYSSLNVDWDEYIKLDDFISKGTLVGNEMRGSSIIGDGLAAAALSFNNLEEDPDRTRIIIFSTDNDLAGEELITLPDAGKICEEKNIIVYGIGTEYMYSGDLKEMKKTVEDTGGEFFYGESNTAVRDIVSAIEDQVETLDDATYEITEVDQPEMPFCLLLTTIAAMILLAFVTKV